MNTLYVLILLVNGHVFVIDENLSRDDCQKAQIDWAQKGVAMRCEN